MDVIQTDIIIHNYFFPITNTPLPQEVSTVFFIIVTYFVLGRP